MKKKLKNLVNKYIKTTIPPSEGFKRMEKAATAAKKESEAVKAEKG